MSEAYEKAREAHKAGGPYGSAYDAIKSKTFSKMHSERKNDSRSKALEKKRMKLSEKIGNHAWPGLTEHNNAAAMSIDKHNRSEKTGKGCGIKGCKYDD